LGGKLKFENALNDVHLACITRFEGYQRREKPKEIRVKK